MSIVRSVPPDYRMSDQYHQTTECHVSATRLYRMSGQYRKTTECQVSTKDYWMSVQYQQTLQIAMSLPTDSIQNVRSLPPDSTECQVSTNRLQNVRAVPPTTECQVSTNRLCLQNVRSIPLNHRILGKYHQTIECQVSTTWLHKISGQYYQTQHAMFALQYHQTDFRGRQVRTKRLKTITDSL